jgi:uridine nucleosidase
MIATPEIIDNLLYGFDQQANPSIVRVLFKQILTFFAKTYADVFALVDGPPLHDPLAVAACFVPDLFEDAGGERFSVDVVIDGEHGTDDIVRNTSQCGRTVVTKLHDGEAGVRIPRGLRKTILWRMLDLCLREAEGENPQRV